MFIALANLPAGKADNQTESFTNFLDSKPGNSIKIHGMKQACNFLKLKQSEHGEGTNLNAPTWHITALSNILHDRIWKKARVVPPISSLSKEFLTTLTSKKKGRIQNQGFRKVSLHAYTKYVTPTGY